MSTRAAGGGRARRVPHPIEERSYALLAERVSLDGLTGLTRAVTARVVHATAEPAWAGDLVCSEAALAQGLAALRGGAAVVADVRMTAAGITARPVLCAMDLAPPAAPAGSTRVAAGVRAAAERTGPGAVWVIGCAPTALAALVDLDTAPALVIGVPVGFVGAVAAKAALRASGLPAVSNRSERGGAAAAAAAFNAVLYALEEDPG